jgi:hypothetical protein
MVLERALACAATIMAISSGALYLDIGAQSPLGRASHRLTKV